MARDGSKEEWNIVLAMMWDQKIEHEKAFFSIRYQKRADITRIFNLAQASSDAWMVVYDENMYKQETRH